MSLITKLDPRVREARRARVELGNQYAVKAFRVGRSTTLGMAYTAAVVALERLRKIPFLTGAQKQTRVDRINALVREHEAKTMADAELSAAANVATSRHSKVLEQIQAEEKRKLSHGP